MRLPRFLRRSTAERTPSLHNPPSRRPAMPVGHLGFPWPADADRPRPHAPGAPCPHGDGCIACRPATPDERRAAVDGLFGVMDR